MTTPPLHIVLGLLRSADGRYLIAQRATKAHQGGLWEFPGGKVEAGEGADAALVRELQEELGVTPTQFRPLIRIPHDYGDRRVLLDAYLVEAWQGEPHGREGQPTRWVSAAGLDDYPFPAANRPLLRAAQLPDRYLITPEPGPGPWDGFLARLDAALTNGVRLVQLRAHELDDAAYRQLAEAMLPRVRAAGGKLLLNRPAADPWLDLADGIHLTRHQLAQAYARPYSLISKGGLIGVSCHDADELTMAQSLRADFALLSPVLPTASHPDALGLGWPRFAELTADATLPIYALGGQSPELLPTAWAHGAQGIAAIRSLFDVN